MNGSTWLNNGEAVIPDVDSPNDNIVPRVRIYDASNNGSYWFRRAGFTTKLTDEG
jgi:hypothetical protein